MVRKVVIVMAVIVCAVCVGCESHAQNKKLAKKRWDKASARMKLVLAQQQYNEGDYEQAEKTSRECVKADPDNTYGRVMYGKVLLANGRSDRAIEQLRVAVQSDEKLHEGWYWFGVAAQEKRDYKNAFKHYERALSLEPTNVDYILAVADVQVAQNNCARAVELLTRKMAILPREVSLKVTAADLMCRLGRNEQAIRLYKEAMLLASDNETIAEALGYCYIFSGKWAQATEIFDNLLQQSPDDQSKRLYLQAMALCSMNSGQYGRAVNCYSKLSIEQRDDAEIWLKMGQAALGAGAANRAFVCGRKALTLRPGYADAIVLIGCAQYADGNYSTAIKSFEKIAGNSKNEGFSWLMRARCYEQLGAKSQAERSYKKALEINPDSELNTYLVNRERGPWDKSQNGTPESYIEQDRKGRRGILELLF